MASHRIRVPAVECGGEPRIKLSEEIHKTTIPGRKRIYRLYGGPAGTTPLADYMALATEAPPTANPNSNAGGGNGILGRDPFRSHRRFTVVPKRVVELQSTVFPPPPSSSGSEPSLSETREYVRKQLAEEFGGITGLAVDGDDGKQQQQQQPYDLLVSPDLYDYLHKLWDEHAPVPVRR